MANLRLKYVNGFVNKDRNDGRARFYFRRRGCRAIPLPGLPGSDEFLAAYAAALGTLPEQAAAEIGERRTLPGTINALVVAYYKSDEWNHGLKEETRKTRRRIIEKFRDRHGDKRVALLHREHISLGTQQRLVMEFALETTSRRGEVVRLGPQHVRNGRIRIERTHGSADVDIPMSPELQAACEAMPKAI